MKRTVFSIVAVAVVLTIAVAPGFAGEVSGANVLVPKASTTTELPNGKTYQAIGNSQVCRTDPADHPLNNASGDCDGGCIDDVCMGSCTWADTDGDLAFFTWTGQNEGSWELRGGSGKWENASGSGTWWGSSVFSGGMAENSWKGNIDM